MFLSDYEPVMVFLQYYIPVCIIKVYNTLLFLSIDDDTIHAWLIIVALLTFAAVVGAVLIYFVKIDLILAYRQCKSKKIFISTDQRGVHTHVCYLCVVSSSIKRIYIYW